MKHRLISRTQASAVPFISTFFNVRKALMMSVSTAVFMLTLHHAHAQTAPSELSPDTAAVNEGMNAMLKNSMKAPDGSLVATPTTGNPDADPIVSAPNKTTYDNNAPTDANAPPALPPLPTEDAALPPPVAPVTPINMPNPEGGNTDSSGTPMTTAEAASTASAMNSAALNGQAMPTNDALNPNGLPPLPAMPSDVAPDASALPPIIDANGLATANPSAPLPSLAFDDLDDDNKATKGKKGKKAKKKKKSHIAYDYHRQEMPPTISKAAYNMDNRHLPQAMYWQQLEMDMFYAARAGNLNAMRALVTKGVSVNLHNQLGEPLITLAARYGRTQVVHWLIVHGSRINDVSASGQTALHVALAKGDAAMVKVLLDGGADANMPDERGVYPLAMASDRGMSDAAAILKEYGAM